MRNYIVLLHHENLTIINTFPFNIESYFSWLNNFNILPNKIALDDQHNTFVGLDGDDIIGGGAGDDILNGGSGNDTLNGGAGDDTLNGGDGDDLYVYNGIGSDEIEDQSGVDTLKLVTSDVAIISDAGGYRSNDDFVLSSVDGQNEVIFKEP